MRGTGSLSGGATRREFSPFRKTSHGEDEFVHNTLKEKYELVLKEKEDLEKARTLLQHR